MAIWFGHSGKKDNVNALRLRARGVAVLLFGVESELRQQLLEYFPKDDQSLILEESEKALRYTTTERIDEISRYLEITVSRSLLREGSLEKKLIASLEAALRSNLEAAGEKLRRRLHPADKITIGVALQAISDGKANSRRQALVLSALPTELVRDVLDHLPHRIASSLEKTLPGVTRVRDRDRLQTLCDFLELSPEGRTLEDLTRTAQTLAESTPDVFAKQLQGWNRRPT
jgi:hypothetical protein